MIQIDKSKNHDNLRQDEWNTKDKISETTDELKELLKSIKDRASFLKISLF